MGRAPQTKTVATRLRENSNESPDGCWLWNKSTVTGYGQMWVGSRADGSRRRVLAHRASYEAFVGPVPEGKEVDHLCFNRLCINPMHLEPVTPQENVRRHWARPSTATELPPHVVRPSRASVEILLQHQPIANDVAMNGYECLCGWGDDDWRHDDTEWAEHVAALLSAPALAGTA